MLQISRAYAAGAVTGLALAMVAAATGEGRAQSGADAGWPNRAIRCIVPFPAGSTTDVIARMLGQMLTERLGQAVVVENRAGASGNIGTEAIARAAPDGYTIGIATTSTHALAPNLEPKPPYDPVRDFAPVSLVASTSYVMVVYPGLKLDSVGDFIARAKAQPGKLNYGSAGPMSLAHLATVLFAEMTGVKLVHVPYKSTSQSVTDLITGRLDMQLATIPPSLPLIRAGQLKALAVTSARRSAAFPDLPTLAESGLPGYDAVLWTAVVMPAKTPPAIVGRLNRALAGLLDTAAVRGALEAQGLDVEPSTPDGLSALINADIEKWRAVIAKASFRAD